jgi:hypothetical protein
MISDEHASSITSAADHSSIFWITGSAGTGKTTIAYTVAEDCKKANHLGASFFCSRDDADCSNPRFIFTTIAYQLGLYNSLYHDQVTQVLKLHPDIGYSDVSYQLEQLIVNPLQTLGNSFPPCVVILDALDECKDRGATSIILSSLSRYIQELSPLRFLVTSRPESHISTSFKSSELHATTQRLILHEVKLGIVQCDIEQYLSSKLAVTAKTYSGLLETWPSPDDIHSLALLSCGLFIFAATSIRFIEDRNYSDPVGQLAILLQNTSIGMKGSLPFYHPIDKLYIQVLDHAFPSISFNLSGRLKLVLGTIVLLQDPLSSTGVACLLGLELHIVQSTLLHLHSVVIVPEDNDQAIRLLHPSLFDFITEPKRCLNQKFLIEPKIQHTLLASACLEVMKELHQDICGIRDLSLLNSEVGGLPRQIMKNIPAHLQYACRHWAWHLSHGMISDRLLDLLQVFCSKYLLFWIEVCSLLGELQSVLIALDTAQQMLVVCRSSIYFQA